MADDPQLLSDKLEQVRKQLEENKAAQDEAMKQDKELGRMYAEAISAGDSKLQNELKNERKAMQKQISDMAKQQKNLTQSLSMTTRASVVGLSENIAAQNAKLAEELSISELSKKIESFQGGIFTETTATAAMLKDQFTQLNEILSNPQSSQAEMALAKEQLEVLKESANTEEERREKEKLAKEENKMMASLVDGLNGLQKTFENAIDGLGKGALGLGAALLLFDPETLIDGVVYVLNYIKDGFDAIQGLFDGEAGPMMDLIENHTAAFAATMGIIAVKFGIFSAAAKVVSGIATAISFITTGGLTAAMTGILATMSTAVAAAAPFVLIGAAIAAVGVALYQGFNRAKEVFDSSGSITEALLTLITDVITAPLRWAKDLAAWALNALGFEGIAAQLEAFDLTSFIVDPIMGIFDYIGNMISGVIDFIKEKAAKLDIFGIFTDDDEEKPATKAKKAARSGTFMPKRTRSEELGAEVAELADERMEKDGYMTKIAMKQRELAKQLAAEEGWKGDALNDHDIIMDAYRDAKRSGDPRIKEHERKARESQMARGKYMKKAAADLQIQMKEDSSGFGYEYTSMRRGVGNYAAAPQGVERRGGDTSLRDNQVENNALKDQEKSAAVVPVPAPQSGGGGSNANVSSTTVNMTNTLDTDSMLNDFVFSP